MNNNFDSVDLFEGSASQNTSHTFQPDFMAPIASNSKPTPLNENTISNKVLVRIKRKRSEAPTESLIIDNSNECERTSKIPRHQLFKLVSTVDSKKLFDSENDSNLRSGLLNALKTGKKEVKQRGNRIFPPDDIWVRQQENLRMAQRDQILQQRKLNDKVARYEILKKNRLLPDSDDDDETDEFKGKSISLYDIVQKVEEEPEDESDVTLNLQRLIKEKLSISSDSAQEYVYDVYELEDNKNPLNLQPSTSLAWLHINDDDELGSELRIKHPQESEGESDTQDEDEDSNAEDYYANDYPEEENEEYSDFAYDSDQYSDY